MTLLQFLSVPENQKFVSDVLMGLCILSTWAVILWAFWRSR